MPSFHQTLTDFNVIEAAHIRSWSAACKEIRVCLYGSRQLILESCELIAIVDAILERDPWCRA